MWEIKVPSGNKIVQLANFETCLAAAASRPNEMDALIGIGDNSWLFLSEVSINQGQAKLSFSHMDAGSDFVQ